MNPKPKCVIVTGRPGAGKTTLSKELGRVLYLPVISRDEIKEGYVNTSGIRHDLLPAKTNGVATNIFFAVASQLLSQGVSVVIEAAFSHTLWEAKMKSLTDISRVRMVICSVDGEVAASRHLQRGLKDPNREFYHGDKRVSVYRTQGVISPPEDYLTPTFDVPTLAVSTLDAYHPSLEKIKDFVLGRAG